MSHHSMSRSQRAKGSKAKNIFQVTVLLAVVLWLLYQTKHSYDKKSEYAETEYSKLNKGDTNIKLGRKVNAGSENVISIESQGKNSDETSDTGESGEAGVDQDVFGDEEKAEEVRHESEESREYITDSGKEETLQEQGGNVDDNGDPHNANKVNTEGIQEGLRLPSQRDGGSFNQNENQTEDVNSSEENGLLKGDATTADQEKIASDEAMLSTTNQAENGETTEQQSEMGEAGSQRSDSAVPVAQELTNSSVSDDRSNQDLSVDKDSHEETVKAQEATESDAESTSNNTIEEARTNARSDVEPRVDSASHEEITDNSSAEAAGPDRSSQDGSGNFPKSIDENNVVMPDSNGAPGGEEGVLQTDIITEGQATGNYSIEAVTADTNSEGENAILPNSSEENGKVMSDNNGVPKEEEVQPQVVHVSEGEKADNSSEEAKADKSDSVVLETEVNASDAEATTTVAVESSPKSSDEAANSSLTSNKEHAELPANAKVQSQGDTGSDAENISKSSLEEEKADNLPAKSAQNNEQNSSDLPTSGTPNEEGASHEDNALKVGSASQNVEDATGEV